MMSSFVYPSLVWGLALIGVPVLIHLINLLRHRRVEWAAMEFLLASQKRNRTRVLLRQLLLLLVRMAAVALVVLVLAEPLFENRLGSLLGDGKTHHLVLLDDSFSMSDRRAETNAFEEAKRGVERIGTQIGRQAQSQTFTLLRFSQAGRVSLGTQPDLLEETVNADFAGRLHETLDSLSVSHAAAGPTQALEAIAQLLGDSEGDRPIVYLISDFRAREWDDPVDLKNHLARLNQAGASLHLINAVDARRANLAIADLSPVAGTRAAGVPLFMEVTVTNFGAAPVKDIPVLIQADGLPRPALKISGIPPGESVKERFQVHFPTAGQHVITTHLEPDAVTADNFRFSAVDFPDDVPVLLIDGDAEATDARYLSAALAPGGPIPTGVSPRIEGPRYLRLNPLDGFGAIYLLNIDRLDPSAIAALEAYVRSGGGVGIFLGEQCRAGFINEKLYREGNGLFPAPLAGQTELLVDRLEKAPDLEVVGDHPIFRIFAGKRNSFLATVIVSRYFSVPEGWEPGPDSTTRVIARLRNGAPLAVERNFGDGRVVAFLTTAAPTWNNWARNNPSFVVAMLEMQAFLASRPSEDVSNLVGSPVEIEFDPSRYDAAVRFSTPEEHAVPMAAIDAVATPEGALCVSLPVTDRSGVYEATLTRKDGTQEVRRYALNVEAEEGDLETLGGRELAERLKGIEYAYEPAAEFEYAAEELAGYNMSEPLLYLLVLLLIGEQILAWSAGYHPPAGHRREAVVGGVGRASQRWLSRGTGETPVAPRDTPVARRAQPLRKGGAA
ncbi:MAG: BatA domain-containing protein [Planctomycetota bacterium]